MEKESIVRAKELQSQAEDMDFQLNPNAAEFIPTAVSPTLLDRRNIADLPISGSPLKQQMVMDDIQIPSQSEFDEEVCRRPREVDEDYTNGDNPQGEEGLDVSEISSTKAELGDESLARIIAATQQWQAPADSSQWSAKLSDDTTGGFDREEEYNIATDPMAMSLGPGDIEAVFDKGVDLNAVHDLSTVDVDDKDKDRCFAPLKNTPPCSPERAHTPVSEEKIVDLMNAASSTPYLDENLAYTPAVVNHVKVSEEMLNAEPVELRAESSAEKKRSVSPPLADEAPQELDQIPPLIFELQFAREDTGINAHSEVSDMLGLENVTEACSTKSSDACITEPTHPDIPESKSSPIQCLDPFDASDFVSNNISDLKNPLDSQNIENLDFAELSSSKVETSTNLTIQQLDADVNPELICHLPSEFVISTENVGMSDLAENFGRNEMYQIETDQTMFADVVNPLGTPLDASTEENASVSEQERSEKFSCEIEADKISADSAITVPKPLLSMQDFTTAEEQLQSQKVQQILSEATLLPSAPTEPEKEKESVEITSKIEISEDSSKNVPLSNKKEIESHESVTKTEDKPKEKSATKATAAVTSSTKPKITMTTKRPIKTATTATTVTKTITKMATKTTTPTSPTKTIGTTARTTVTASAVSAATRKVAAARPSKQADGSAKTTVSNIVAKSGVAKTTTAHLKPPTTGITVTKVTTSPRVGATRPKTTVTSPKPSTTGTSAENRSMASGDAKSANKPATIPKRTVSKTTTSNSVARAASVKSPSAIAARTTATAMSKPRPTSAVPTTKTTTSSKPATSIGGSAPRPKTAPVSANRVREDPTKTMTAVKSLIIDKQVKETANKQISLGRTGASSTGIAKSGRASAPTSITTAATTKSRTTTTRSSSTSATSPTKKSTSRIAASKVKTTTTTTTSSNNKQAKTLSNGVPENTVIADNVITTTTNDELVDDDVPKKDASPLDVPTDNQLIVTAD